MKFIIKEINKKSREGLNHIAIRATRWIGSTNSLAIHTVLFFLSFLLYFIGVELNNILLVLTTIVSLEAIYLSIFIQMSVNRHTRELEAVAEDVEDIQEEDKIEEIEEKKDEEILTRIENTMSKLIEEVTELKKQQDNKK